MENPEHSREITEKIIMLENRIYNSIDKYSDYIASQNNESNLPIICFSLPSSVQSKVEKKVRRLLGNYTPSARRRGIYLGEDSLFKDTVLFASEFYNLSQKNGGVKKDFSRCTSMMISAFSKFEKMLVNYIVQEGLLEEIQEKAKQRAHFTDINDIEKIFLGEINLIKYAKDYVFLQTTDYHIRTFKPDKDYNSEAKEFASKCLQKVVDRSTRFNKYYTYGSQKLLKHSRKHPNSNSKEKR